MRTSEVPFNGTTTLPAISLESGWKREGMLVATFLLHLVVTAFTAATPSEAAERNACKSGRQCWVWIHFDKYYDLWKLHHAMQTAALLFVSRRK